MSWLSSNLNISDSLSSLSNITGQISSFTREMLTEGTEEVEGKNTEIDLFCLCVSARFTRNLWLIVYLKWFECR